MTKMRLALPRNRLGNSLLIAALTIIVVLLLRSTGRLEPLELAHFDRSLRVQAGASNLAPVVQLILIDEDDIRRFGHPLRDETLRTLLAKLLEFEPRAIGVDLYRDMPVPPDLEVGPSLNTPAYSELGELVRADPRIVMVSKLPDGDQPGTPQPRFLTGPGQVGVVDIPTDAGGIVRRVPLYLWEGETTYMSLSFQLARLYLWFEELEPGADEGSDDLKWGDTVISPFESDWGPYVAADAGGYQMLLDYRNGRDAFPRYSVRDIMARGSDLEHIRDSVVIVATATHSVKDSFATPLAPYGSDEETYGGVVHAHAVEQLVRYARGQSAPQRTSPANAILLMICIAALAGAGLGSWNRSLLLQVTGLSLLLEAVHLLADHYFGLGLWLPAVPVMFAATLAAIAAVALRAVVEGAERRQIRLLFSRFQGPKVAEEIWRNRAQFLGEAGRPESRWIRLTSMMSDLEGYTSAAEEMEPAALMDWINEYMRAMADIVDHHGGVVDDYAGDGIKANFGFPVPRDSEAEIDADARAAVECALAMGAQMEVLNRRWAAKGQPIGRCRIGLFTGPAVVGCIGGHDSLRMTSVGDTVNTAARLEGFAKDDFKKERAGDPWRLLIGAETRHRVGDAFVVVDLGPQSLKGKEEPVPIFRVLAAR